MAGGTFLTKNKIRPGAYINFKSYDTTVGNIADRGICAVPIQIDFGEDGKITEVHADSDFIQLFGKPISHAALAPVKEILKNAKTCLVYRLCGGAKATGNIGNLTITAKYGGTGGNTCSVKVLASTDGGFYIDTYLNNDLVERQTVATISDISNNDWVCFMGEDTLTVGFVTLSGGNNTETTVQHYSDFLSAVSLWNFQTIAIPTSEEVVLHAAISFVKRMREEEGMKCQVVLSTNLNPDYEGVINVQNGVVLADGTVVSPLLALCFVAGATAGAQINQSLTHMQYDGAVDVLPKYTNSEIIKHLQTGHFVFTEESGVAVCEQDINSFVSFTTDKASHFAKNRVVRVLDSIANDIQRIFRQGYSGKVSNNETGRALFKSECIKYLETLMLSDAVTDFTADGDISVAVGDDLDSIVVNLFVQPVDSMEKLYMTVYVRG